MSTITIFDVMPWLLLAPALIAGVLAGAALRDDQLFSSERRLARARHNWERKQRERVLRRDARKGRR
jgi:hypothetical protein